MADDCPTPRPTVGCTPVEDLTYQHWLSCDTCSWTYVWVPEEQPSHG